MARAVASCKTLTVTRVHESVFIRLVEEFDFFHDILVNASRGSCDTATDFGETTFVDDGFALPGITEYLHAYSHVTFRRA